MAVIEGTNSYISLDDAITYFLNRLHTTEWDNASSSESEKEYALIWACNLMETRIFWLGSKTSSTQTLQWPRSGLTDQYGDSVSSSTIPQIIKDVQCELALYLLESNPMAVSQSIEKMDLDGILLNLKSNNGVIPWKIFQPVAIYGSLLDNPPSLRLNR